MAEAVGAAAAAVAQILTTLPDIGRKLVRWRDVHAQNPIRVHELLEDINDCRSELGTFVSIYENLERDPSVQLPHTAPVVKEQFAKLRRKLDRAEQEYNRLNSSRKTAVVYPNELCNKITSVAEDVDKVNTVMTELKQYLQPQPVPGPSDAVQERFVVVNNVPHNPPDVYLDFASKDENGNPRTHEAKLKHAIFSEDDRSAIGAVARGSGGVGKTCALRGIGLLVETKKRFTGGTLYMTIGADGGLSRLIESIAEIVEKAGSKQRADRIRDKNTLSEATSVAGEWLQHQICLFLIDDVWCVNGITPGTVQKLTDLARHEMSRIAFTARDTDVECGRKIVFRERPKCGEQSRRILLRCADMQVPTGTKASDAFNRILGLCNGLPIGLSVCGRAVKHYAQERCGMYPENAWIVYWERRQDRPVLQGDRAGRAKDMKESIQLSLDLIDEELRMSMSRRWYRALCVLEKQQVVSSDVLRRLWSVSKDIADEFIDCLERFGIARVDEAEAGKRQWIGLHDVLLDISREMAVESEELGQWSTALIASYVNGSSWSTSHSDRGAEALDRFREWWIEVEDDGFMFKNICRLLKLGGYSESLLWMMRDAEWIIKQLLKNGHRQVQEDIKASTEYLNATCSEDERTKWEQVQGFLKALHYAVQLSAERVRESKWNGMAWFEVYGRLVHLQEKNEVVRRFLEEVKDKAPRPWLKPSAGCLAPAGESLRHVMELRGELLCQIEVDSIVLACYMDARSVYIKRYDTQTEIESSADVVLSNVWGVSCAAFSSSGEHLAVVLGGGRIIICILADCEVGSAHGDSNDPRQYQRSEAGVESEMSEEGENIKCGIMGWRHIFGWCYFGRKECGEGRDLAGDRDCEGDNSDEGSGKGLSREEDICSRYEVEYVSGSIEGVTSIAVSDDGRQIVSGFRDTTVRVWEKDGDEWVSAVLPGHNDMVWCVSMNGDGTRIVSGSRDTTVRVWEKDGDEWVSAVLPGHDYSVYCVSMNGDGTRIVSGSRDTTVRVWEKDGDEWVSAVLPGHDYSVYCVSMNGDGTRVASGSFDRIVRVWEKDGDKWVSAVLHGHNDMVWCVSMNGDGIRIASGSPDKTVRVWEKDGDEWVSAVFHGHDDWVRSVSMNEDGTRLVSGSHDHTVRVWEKDGDKWVSAVLPGHVHWVRSVWMSRDGQHIVSQHDGNKTLSWRKQGKWCVTVDDGVGDVSLARSHVADEDVSWKGQVSHELFDDVVRPLATMEFFPTAFGYFITMRRKPYVAQIDVLH